MIRTRCLECDKDAQWYVWYKDVALPMRGFNIAYNHFCTTHAIEEMKNGRDGYQVEYVKLISREIFFKKKGLDNE